MRTADALTRSRLARWEELELLVAQAAGRLQRLTGSQIERLGVLYRGATSDLAVARRDFPGDRVCGYLERLVARAHPVLFRNRGFTPRRAARLLVDEFPRAVLALAPAHLASALAFLGAAGVAFALGLLFPETFRGFVPDAILQRIVSVGEALRTDGVASWTGSAAGWSLAANNVHVALLAFAGGALLGLFTLHILVVNGALLGLVTAFAVHEGAFLPLGTFAAAHAFLEISVVVLAGGAGLAIGHGWLCPGERSRLDVVVGRGRLAVVVALGGACVMVFAAVLERLVSPSDLPPWVKLAIGAGSAALLWFFLLRGGKRSPGSLDRAES